MNLWAITISCDPVKFSGHRQSGIEDIMFLVYHMILKDHVIKGSRDFMGESSHRHIRSGYNRPCGSGDIMFLVVKEQDSRYSHSNPPLFFISKASGLKAHTMS